MLRSAVCPGSFDPITLGHLDIIKRASKLFDQVIVLVVVNPDKAPSFTPEERMEMIRLATADIGNITVDSYDGLLIDYVRRTGAAAIVKGLRAVSDFEYEFQMAMTNKKMYPYAETLFLTTSMYNMYLSSSLVKQIARFGGDISDFVPFPLHNFIYERLTQGRGSFNEY
ncbi:MAG TPA: pantetheine-phosphate adenylyltransferase [Candidatus Fimivivens faecavium]|nr:pantetheine-phosphate adenylyltransferase [Candidatus Fimivivens faecavium]